MALPNFTEYIRSQDAVATVRSNNFALSAVSRYFGEISERREIHVIPPNELDGLLGRFFMEVKKKDGSPYEPDCLSVIQRALKRYLENMDYEANILVDKSFETSRKVLAARRKELRKQGLGGKPNAARELTATEEEMLFKNGYFGTDTSDSLQRGVWWFLAINCGFRGNDESKKLCWGDIILEHDAESNRDYLIWVKERGTKTRDGRESEAPRKIRGTVYSTGTERCPISYYKLFASHRPENGKTPASPFFLSIDWRKKKTDQIWYYNQAMGVNTIARFLHDAKKRFNLPGNVSNHSVRKTGIGRLLDANVPEIYVAQHSGMKNTDSLSSYKHANRESQVKMSDILNHNINQAETKQLSTAAREVEVTHEEEGSSSSFGLGALGFRQPFKDCNVTININNSGNPLPNNMLIEDRRENEAVKEI